MAATLVVAWASRGGFVRFSRHRGLDDGAKVSYESEEGPKGPVATNVSLTSG